MAVTGTDLNRQRSAPKRGSAHGFRALANAYLALSKPRIIELLIVTTIPAMLLAARGIPNPLLILATFIGGAASAASANAFNCYIDRDIDKLMHRTSSRPLVTGALSPRQALRFSWIMAIGSTAWLWLTTNWFAAILSVTAIFLYVVLYSLILKRRTEQNIVWGGVAGCMPVLIGWAAVTGSLSWAPFVMFGIIFLWTPPHYWPLSVKYQDDYNKASVPMLSVTRHNHTVNEQIILYAWAMVVCSLLLIPIAPMGWIYTVSALALGAWFLYECHALYRASSRGTARSPMRVFHGSIAYLSGLFVMIAVDALIYLPLH